MRLWTSKPSIKLGMSIPAPPGRSLACRQAIHPALWSAAAILLCYLCVVQCRIDSNFRKLANGSIELNISMAGNWSSVLQQNCIIQAQEPKSDIREFKNSCTGVWCLRQHSQRGLTVCDKYPDSAGWHPSGKILLGTILCLTSNHIIIGHRARIPGMLYGVNKFCNA